MNENDIIIYTVKDLASIFRCGMRHAYALANAKNFPSIRIGGKILVEKKALEDWVQKHKGKSIFLD